MKERRNIWSPIIAFCLAAAVMLPVATGFASIFLHGQHDHCTETATVHFHEKESDCSLCDFHITLVILLSSSSEESFTSDNYKNIISSYSPFFKEFNPLHFNLRGPPEIS